MEERELRNNYVFTLVKFILFLIIFCFLVEITREFWHELRVKESFKINVLVVSLLSTFAFYAFVADLNSFYKKIQNFFFHSTFFSCLIPSLLVLAGVGYFFLPKVLKITFNRDAFVFIGGFIFTSHLIFVARANRGSTFTTAISYLFIFSILYILNLILFGVYLRVGFRVHVGKIIFSGLKDGASLIQNIFTQAFR